MLGGDGIMNIVLIITLIIFIISGAGVIFCYICDEPFLRGRIGIPVAALFMSSAVIILLYYLYLYFLYFVGR